MIGIIPGLWILHLPISRMFMKYCHQVCVRLLLITKEYLTFLEPLFFEFRKYYLWKSISRKFSLCQILLFPLNFSLFFSAAAKIIVNFEKITYLEGAECIKSSTYWRAWFMNFFYPRENVATQRKKIPLFRLESELHFNIYKYARKNYSVISLLYDINLSVA